VSRGARRGSLVVVGTGISLVGQATLEAVAHMERAEKLFYVANNPAVEEWIRRLNASAIPLHGLYGPGKRRERTYREMADRILSDVRAGFRVCAAFYGHPGVFVRPSHDAIRRARREGFSACMLPGISSEDCLFADLGLNPGESGCQSYEATDFLAHRRRIDATAPLVLWQAGVLGESSVRDTMRGRPERLGVLTDALRRHYGPRHPVVLYEAALFPICNPRVERIALERLPRAAVMPMTTLYIPPRPSRPMNKTVARWLRE
jgi:precorrin-3B methylase